MKYTIKSAKFANAEGDSVLLDTEEAGAVIVSQKDTPEDWDEVLKAATPASYAPPEDKRDYRGKRAEAYIKELGKVSETNFQTTCGDMLDIAFTMLETMRVSANVPATPEWAARIAKIGEIKQRFPKA